MITYDLGCENGHRFEGWFKNREEFERQLAGLLIHCPVCESNKVEKRPSAVPYHQARSSSQDKQQNQLKPESFMRALSTFVENHFEDVGENFADVAQKMENGEEERRSIRGTTTQAEEEALKDSGIEFFKLALPKYDS